MSKANELLGGLSVIPPERLDEDEDDIQVDFNEEAIFASAVQSVHDTIGKEDFKLTWMTIKEDIENQTDNRQRNFVEQTTDKIFEIYDFEFPIKIDYDTKYDIHMFYKFLEFLEYDNVMFLSYVWKHLKDNLMKLDIEKFCKDNEEKIIKEIEEQTDSHPQDRLIALFLRTYYKEKLIEWFIKNSIQNRIEITVEIMEG